MSDRTPVSLMERDSGQLVEATLIEGVSREEVENTEAAWRPVVEQVYTVGDRHPQHAHWDWRRKLDATHSMLAYSMFGIECRSDMQGLMLLSVAGHFCRLPGQIGKDLVYVEYVATAPWNLRGVVPQPRYKLVGSIFIATAIQVSLHEGFHGRIGLHALPQSEYFYEKCGMSRCGKDPGKEGLEYFEMTPEQANKFLNR